MRTPSGSAPAPLLSLCIPTFNRAGWLRATLEKNAPQVAALGGLVELVVSDNASPDRTAQVVEEMQTVCPIRFIRQERNIGGMPNMYASVEGARGQYSWVLGDDDFLRPHALAQIVGVMREQPDLDYFYVNYSSLPVSPRADGSLAPEDYASLTPTGSPDCADRYVARIGDLFGLDVNVFTPVYHSILRHARHLDALEKSRHGTPFSSMESAVSHAAYMAEQMMDQPCYYFGEPRLVAAQHSAWSEYSPIYMLKLMPDLLDRFEARGNVDPARLREVRRHWLNRSGGVFWEMVGRADVPQRAQFSWPRYLLRHRRFVPTLARSLGSVWLHQMRARAALGTHARQLLGRGSGAPSPAAAPRQDAAP